MNFVKNTQQMCGFQKTFGAFHNPLFLQRCVSQNLSSENWELLKKKLFRLMESWFIQWLTNFVSCCCLVWFYASVNCASIERDLENGLSRSIIIRHHNWKHDVIAYDITSGEKNSCNCGNVATKSHRLLCWCDATLLWKQYCQNICSKKGFEISSCRKENKFSVIDFSNYKKYIW